MQARFCLVCVCVAPSSGDAGQRLRTETRAACTGGEASPETPCPAGALAGGVCLRAGAGSPRHTRCASASLTGPTHQVSAASGRRPWFSCLDRRQHVKFRPGNAVRAAGRGAWEPPGSRRELHAARCPRGGPTAAPRCATGWVARGPLTLESSVPLAKGSPSGTEGVPVACAPADGQSLFLSWLLRTTS